LLNYIFQTSNKLLLGLCVISLTALVLITVIDVLGRYLLSLPLPGTTEITEIILGALIYIGLPYITRLEEHVTVSLFTNYFRNSIIKIQKIVINFIVSVILFIIARQLYMHGLDLNIYNEITTFLQMPKAPIAYMMATLSMIASIIALCNSYKYLFNEKKKIINEVKQ